MINININEDKCSVCLNIEGHSTAAARGQDIICASVSTLAFAAAETFVILELSKTISDLIIDFASGRMSIQFTRRKKAREVNGALKTIKCGLELLSEKFPEQIKLIYSRKAV